MATDELTARRQRLEQLRKQGFDPYPSTIKRSHSIKEVLEQFGELQKKVETITVCGRIMAGQLFLQCATTLIIYKYTASVMLSGRMHILLWKRLMGVIF